MASQNGHAAILKLLIKAGGDVNQRTIEQKLTVSPLQIASHFGHVECVEILLAAGADAFHKNINGHTALDMAILGKHSAVQAVLRAHIAQLQA
jgi:hypothetical protein